jgi:hypothetical protein
MGSRLVAGLVVSALAGGCRPATRNTPAAVQTAGFASPSIASLVPTAAFVQGWTVAEGPLTFRPDTLYEYLDGGAPRYVDYGFREAVHIRYAYGGDAQAAVTLDIYDMGGALGAFGIYSSARPPGVEARPWGAEGYRFETVAAAWKGPVYVHVQADDERPALVGMAERLAADVTGRAPGQSEAPAILRPLPPGGRVPGSERYVARDLLGHAFLPGGVMATYAVEGGEARLYFRELKDAAAAAAALDRLRAHDSQGGATVRDVRSSGASGFRHQHPTWGSGIVVKAGRYLAGVQGDVPDEAQRRLLDSLVARLVPAP